MAKVKREWSSADEQVICTVDDVKKFIARGGNSIQINASMSAETVDYDVLEQLLAITKTDSEGNEKPAISVIVRKYPKTTASKVSPAVRALLDQGLSPDELVARLEEMASGPESE